MKILVIDDEPDIRLVVRLSLLGRGFVVLEARSGGDGVRLARAERPDAVLLDVMMPLMDGPATLAELRARPETAGIPVIFLTAKAQPSELARLRGLGAQGVLTKPFDPIRLPEELRTILTREA